MVEFEHQGIELGRIHEIRNDNKLFCHFTGFLEGILASRHLEKGEIEPLIAESEEFFQLVSDGDANDIIEDFHADLLEKQTLQDAIDCRFPRIDHKCVNSSVNRFLGLCKGVVCDGRITLLEAKRIVETINSNKHLLKVTGINQICVSCLDAIEDDRIDKNEEQDICSAIGQIVGASYGETGLAQTDGVANYEEFIIQHIKELEGTTAVLTGKFDVSPRSKFENELMNIGMSFKRHVSSNTDFIIIGGTASRDWIELNRGTKLRKAQEINENCGKPQFVSETQISRLLGNTNS